MTQKIRFIGYEAKEARRFLKQLIIGAIVLVVMTGTIAFCAIREMNKQKDPVSVPVAVVVDEATPLVNFALSFISDMESTMGQFTFTIMGESAARLALERGEIAAIMLMPVDLVESIMDGDDRQVHVILSDKNALAAILLEELTASGAKLLACAQSASSTMGDLYRAQDFRSELSDAYDALDAENFRFALSRSAVFERVSASATGSVNVIIYYISTAVLFFLLLFGISFVSFYGKASNHTRHILPQYGIHTGTICVSRFLSMFQYSLFLFIGICIAMPFLISKFSIEAGNVFQLLLLAFLLLLSICSFFFFIFELSPNAPAGILLLFLSSIVLMFLSGCFIPTAFLPESLHNLSVYLPTYYWMRQLFHISSFFTSSYADFSLASTAPYAMAYFVIFTALGLIVHKIKEVGK